MPRLWYYTPEAEKTLYVVLVDTDSILEPCIGTSWQPTPVFLPGESHGQRSLVGYSPQAAESEATERTAPHGGELGA